ncbi:hypothetical protein ABH909_005610 [Pseudomonas sp. BS3782 TE3695]|uniref:hypothetical protein n=1 Tax=Pseudomonas sp. BS3782 TE3695 TaxID=3349323 RepID=UPI003D1EA073
MSEVKRYHVSDTGLSEGVSLGRITVVLAADFDRVTAEPDALQLRLNAADQRVDDLTELLRKSLMAIKRTLQAGRDRIVDLGGDCDGVEYMMNSDLTVQEIRTALKPATEACQFPQSCTTRCDCDIPDFSPGNGNKARRRAAAIEAMRPENQQVMPPAIDDPLTICLGCFGSGTVSTGITEASSTICNGCNGTGREQP